MKKIRNISLLLLGILVLSGCKANNNTKVSLKNSFDYSILGGIGLLNSFDSSVSIGMESNFIRRSKSPTAEEENILNNLKIAQNMITGDVVKSEIKDSKIEGYKYSYTISSQDLSGDNKIYDFYYNETELKTDEFDEKEWRLDGIVLLEETEYKIQGNREKEGNEEEIQFVVKMDDRNYVVIEEETEKGEKEYSYTKFENGQEVFETEVSYEKSISGVVELEFSSEIEGKEREYNFTFYSNEEGDYVRVDFKDNQLKLKYLIKIIKEQDTIRYEFV